MRDLAILTFLTLDGVMQAPGSREEDTSGGFRHGGWAAPFWPEVMEQVEQEAMSQPFDILFGRKTYELFAGHWPNAPKSLHGQKLNDATKYVATSTLTSFSWQNSVRITGNAVAEVSRLKAQDGPILQVHGSGDFAQTLIANDLVDEYRLWTFPVVVGGGKRLFQAEAPPVNLELVKSERTSTGVIMAIYRRNP